MIQTIIIQNSTTPHRQSRQFKTQHSKFNIAHSATILALASGKADHSKLKIQHLTLRTAQPFLLWQAAKPITTLNIQHCASRTIQHCLRQQFNIGKADNSKLKTQHSKLKTQHCRRQQLNIQNSTLPKA